MELYEINAIRNAFRRCYGLQEGLKDNNDLLPLWLESLAYQTGMRLEYIKKNIEIIQGL